MAELFKRIIKETLPILLLTSIGGITAGVFLENVKEGIIMKVPGLLILLPAILGNRGNIAGTLGSRISSGLHLGLIPSDLRINKPLTENLGAALFLNTIISLTLGIVAYLAYNLVGFPGQASILELTLISLIAGSAAGAILAVLTVLTAIFTYSRGLDPDNILIPLVSTVGDIITILCLITTVWLVEILI